MSFTPYNRPTKNMYVEIETQNDYLPYPQLKALWLQGPCSLFSFIILLSQTQIIKLSKGEEF